MAWMILVSSVTSDSTRFILTSEYVILLITELPLHVKPLYNLDIKTLYNATDCYTIKLIHVFID